MIYLAAINVLQGVVSVVVVVLAHRERRDVARERADLLQRIQAPAHAVAAHYNEQEVVSPPAVTPDDDSDYWESREALADRLAATEVNGG